MSTWHLSALTLLFLERATAKKMTFSAKTSVAAIKFMLIFPLPPPGTCQSKKNVLFLNFPLLEGVLLLLKNLDVLFTFVRLHYLRVKVNFDLILLFWWFWMPEYQSLFCESLVLITSNLYFWWFFKVERCDFLKLQISGENEP